MNFNWSKNKDKILQKQRGICFDDVVNAINSGNLVTSIKHPNTKKYPQQSIYLIKIHEYIYMIPYNKSGNEIFLITIIPSRKMNKLYNKG